MSTESWGPTGALSLDWKEGRKRGRGDGAIAPLAAVHLFIPLRDYLMASHCLMAYPCGLSLAVSVLETRAAHSRD